MLNRTLCNLAVSNFKHSPFVDIAKTKLATSISIKNTRLYKSFSNFIYSNSFKADIQLEKSSFAYSLTSVVHISSKKFKNRIFDNENLEMNVNNLNCINCKFLNCGSEKANGGAIISTCQTTLNNCVFRNCSGLNGGALFVAADFKGDNLIFDSIRAIDKNGAICFDDSFNIELNRTSFKYCTARQFGCFSKYGGFFQIISADNVTRCEPRIFTAAFEVGTTKGRFSYLYITDNNIRSRNPGVSVYLSDLFMIEYCYFMNLSSSYPIKQGYALWVDGDSTIITIMKSSFLKCRGELGRVIYIENATSAVIYRCCFDVKMKMAVTGNVVIDRFSIFSQKSCPAVTIEKYVDLAIESDWMVYPAIVLFTIGALLLLNRKKINHLFKKSSLKNN